MSTKEGKERSKLEGPRVRDIEPTRKWEGPYLQARIIPLCSFYVRGRFWIEGRGRGSREMVCVCERVCNRVRG